MLLKQIVCILTVVLWMIGVTGCAAMEIYSQTLAETSIGIIIQISNTAEIWAGQKGLN